MHDQRQYISIEELADRLLSPEVERAFTKVDLEVREMSMSIELDKFQAHLQVRGLIIAAAFLVISIASIFSSVSIIIYLLTQK